MQVVVVCNYLSESTRCRRIDIIRTFPSPPLLCKMHMLWFEMHTIRNKTIINSSNGVIVQMSQYFRAGARQLFLSPEQNPSRTLRTFVISIEGGRSTAARPFCHLWPRLAEGSSSLSDDVAWGSVVSASSSASAMRLPFCHSL